jgi:hypothetical protein
MKIIIFQIIIIIMLIYNNDFNNHDNYNINNYNYNNNNNSLNNSDNYDDIVLNIMIIFWYSIAIIFIIFTITKHKLI